MLELTFEAELLIHVLILFDCKVEIYHVNEMANRSLDWNDPDGIKCANETTPTLNMTKPLEVGTNHQLFEIAVNVTQSMKLPVYFLNVTTLSEYRKDAHTSIYTAVDGKVLSPQQKSDPAKYADCLHWCLPGLPDTWNELLYTRIISNS